MEMNPTDCQVMAFNIVRRVVSILRHPMTFVDIKTYQKAWTTGIRDCRDNFITLLILVVNSVILLTWINVTAPASSAPALTTG